MASYSSPPTYKPSTYAAAQNPDVYAEDYDWVINKLRARGFKTLQDRRAEAEEQRKQRLAAWEAEKQRRRAAGDGETPCSSPRLVLHPEQRGRLELRRARRLGANRRSQA